MKDRGYSYWDAAKFFLRLCKIEVMVGNEFSYKVGDKIELSDGEFKRNTKEPIEHRSDKEVISICDGGDSAKPPNRLHHNVKVDKDEVSMYGKKVHLRSNDTGMADIEGEGAGQTYEEQDPIRQIILSEEDGIKIIFEESSNNRSGVKIEVDKVGITAKEADNLSCIWVHPDRIYMVGKQHVQINKLKVSDTELKYDGQKIMLG